MCVDANRGERAKAKIEAEKQRVLHAQEGLKFHNRETSFARAKNANVIGYTKDTSDIRSQALATIGKGRKQVEDAARAYISTQAVNEGGRSRTFGRKKFQAFLAKQAEVDSIVDNVLGRNQAYALEGAQRKLGQQNARAREALGVPASTPPPVMMPPSDTFGGFLQIANLAIGAVSAFSDIRLKENVKQVGTSSAGYKIYEFNYKGNSTKLRGVMAQDVVTKNPMAVDIVDNYLVVDYSKVDVPMEVV